MTAHGGSRVICPLILNLGSRWSEWSTSRSRPLYPREKIPGPYRIGGCVGPRTGLDALSEEETYLLHLPGTETNFPGHPAL